MSQRLIAACVALPLVVGLLLYAGIAPLPYATYSPGGQINVLGEDENAAEVVQVAGHPVYRDDGQLRMTTVSVSPKGADIGLFTLLGTWIDPDDAVYPEDAVYDDDETAESNREQGALQMATSQDDAVEVAMTELGIDVPSVLVVGALTPGGAAEDVLRVGDRLISIDGTRTPDDETLVDAIQQGRAGEPLSVVIERSGERRTVRIAPTRAPDDGRLLIGITPGYDYDFPFEVKINIPSNIGGPSAGLMFSLAVYDTLTPGSLTGGRTIAGTGEIAADGSVMPIGGIQQKIAGSRAQGVDLFLVPPANCAEALGADAGDMRLVRAETMHDARLALEAYADDRDAALPSCETDQ